MIFSPVTKSSPLDTFGGPGESGSKKKGKKKRATFEASSTAAAIVTTAESSSGHPNIDSRYSTYKQVRDTIFQG